MEFCDNCDNMLYIKIVPKSDDETKTNLTYYCRNCSKEFDNNIKKDKCIYAVDFNKDNVMKNISFNKYTKYDPTLPRTNGLRCINADCPAGAEPEIIYINYDSKNMKYTYMCLDCERAQKDNYIW
tara:strand:- start:259 stop:633 length:375 start_codon:yes stop_codon:yes gene_type:complete